MNINKIGFENFRVFKNRTNFELAPITVLTGTNSSGKSTVIKSLKLFQSFWAQNGFNNKLEFEKGKHQLGNFDMSLSKNSDKKELLICYEFNHILFDKLCIEMTFKLDESSVLKNGLLERACVKRGENILFSITMKDDKQFYGYNYKYIIQELIPLLNENINNLKTEFEDLQDKIGENSNLANGIVFMDDSKLNLEKLHIDYDVYQKLKMLFYDDFSKEFSISESQELNFQNSPYIYNLEILKIFEQIEKTNSFNFIDELWKILVKDFSNIEKKFNYETFKDFIQKAEDNGSLSIDIWKEAFLLSPEVCFKQFLLNQIEHSIDIISNTAVSSPFEIKDFENRFYNRIRVKNETIWQNFYQTAFKSTNQTINEKAIVNCQHIISDALFLERNLLKKNIIDENLTVFSKFENFFTNLYKSIEQDFSQMYFIDSIRANSQRIYMSGNQDNTFNDFILSFLKINFNKEELLFVEKWLKEFDIADKFDIEIISGVGSQIFLTKKGEKTNIIDLGYGVTQFLPILLKIIYCNNTGKRRIIIEEPETNLHPKFQSKLADLFIDAYNTFNIQFILETHSEYFIRKLQFLTAKGEIKTNNSIIYYLSNPDENKREDGEEQISEIHIQSNGRLSKPFGSGFYDEADNLSLDMMKYSLN